MKKNLPKTFKGFIDTTMRDGQQSPLMFDSRKYRFTYADKKALLNAMVKIGIRYFEFFSPVVSTSEKQDFTALSKFLRQLTPDPLYLFAHVRCHHDDITQSIAAGVDGINIYMGIAERARKYNYGYTAADILKLVTKTIITVRRQYPDLYIRFSVEDCFRTPLPEVLEIYDRVHPYVNTLGMPDTVGIATPDQVASHVRILRKRYPKQDIECHFHNDRGLSLINALTAIESGAAYIDTSVWGMAERSGITSLTGILLNIVHEFPEISKSYHLEYCYPLNVLMASILKLHVPYNEPVSLTNRTHTAGVHQKAVLKNGTLYEAHGLHDFGVTKNQLLLGPLSGWNLIYYFLREIEYIDVNEEQAKEIAKQFKLQVSEINKRRKPERLLLDIIRKFRLQKIQVRQQFLEKRVENLQ